MFSEPFTYTCINWVSGAISTHIFSLFTLPADNHYRVRVYYEHDQRRPRDYDFHMGKCPISLSITVVFTIKITYCQRSHLFSLFVSCVVSHAVPLYPPYVYRYLVANHIRGVVYPETHSRYSYYRRWSVHLFFTISLHRLIILLFEFCKHQWLTYVCHVHKIYVFPVRSIRPTRSKMKFGIT